MGKRFIWVSILFILIGSMGMYLFQHKDALTKSPFHSEWLFEDVSNAITDDKRNLYVIDEQKQRITKLNSTGTIQYEIDDHSSEKSSYQYIEMARDQAGKLYVTKVDYLPYSNQIKSESILRYYPDGMLDKVLYSIDYSKEKVRTPRIKAIQIQGDHFYFLLVNGQVVRLNTIHLTSGVKETSFVSDIPKNHYIADITIGTGEMIIYSTERGEMYTLNRGGLERVFVNEQGEIGRGVPESLFYGVKNDMYFVDQHHNEIVRILKGNSNAAVLLNKDKIETQGYFFSLADVKNVSTSSQGSMIITQPNRVTVLDPLGKIDSTYDRGFYSQGYTIFQWWIWILPILLTAISIYTIRYVYVHIMNRRTSLIVKQILLFLFLFAFAMGVFASLLYHHLTKTVEEDAVQQNTALANVMEKRIDGDELQKIMSQQDYMNSKFVKITRSVDGLSDKVNIRIFKYSQGKLYAILSDQHVMFAPIMITPEIRDVLEGNQLDTQTANVDNGFLVLRPVYNSSGKVIGMFELNYDKHTFLEKKDESLTIFNKYLIVIGGFALFLFVLGTIIMLRPIRTLSLSVSEISKGRWQTAATISSSDEVALLSDQVNRMTEHVRSYTEKMTDLNHAYYRFVPRQFLQYLGKETVLDLQLGDQTEQEKTIFIFKMRSFFSFSKNLTLEENFHFINSFLSRFGSIIQQNDGFINKYTGAGALAFFSNHSAQAVQSAIQMRRELHNYNENRKEEGFSPIEIGIAIHKGPIMLGVIGEKDRLEGAAISAHVNLTEELEEVSSALEVSILVTQSVIDDITESKDYRYRNLGVVSISNRNDPIHLYDVYQGDSEEVYRLKEDTKELFEHGVILYQDGRFFDARTNFIEVIKGNPYDKSAKLYFYLCDEYYQQGAPRDWNGTLKIK